MKFGIWYDLRNPSAWRSSYADIYRAALEEIVWAEAVGFDSIFVSEHHVTDDGYLPSVFPALAAIAARTSTVRIGSAILLAPFQHPLRFAEDAAFVDQLSEGRLDLGLGLGYRRAEFEALGVERRARVSLTEELVEIARLAWKGERFSYEGRNWSFSDTIVTPTPFQEGGPRLWLGGSTEAAARRAGRLGCHFMPDAKIAIENFVAYDEELERAGYAPSGFRVAINPSVYVCEDAARGWDEIKHHLCYQYNRYAEWFAQGGTTPAATVADPDELPRDRLVIGTPDDVIKGIRGLYERHPFDCLYFWARLPGQSAETAHRSLELFAREVLPVLGGETPNAC